MKSKKQYLKESRLYLISNQNLETAQKSLKAGADMIQLRIKDKDDKFFLKKAILLRKITKKLNKIFIVNDRIDIALMTSADGVHLGQNDISIKEARKILGPSKLIGKSTHSIKEAKIALDEKADYIGVGPAFATRTKPHYKPLKIKTIKKIVSIIDIPYFIIGGINLKNVSYLLRRGLNRIAVFSSIIKSKNPYDKTKGFLKKLDISISKISDSDD